MLGDIAIENSTWSMSVTVCFTDTSSSYSKYEPSDALNV